MPHRYTPDDKRIALERLDSGQDTAEVSAQLNIPPGTLRAWQRKRQLEQRDHQRAAFDRLEARLLASTLRLLDDIEGIIADAPLNQRATALGVFVDRVLRLEDYRTRRTAADEAEAAADAAPGRIWIEYISADHPPQAVPGWAKQTADALIADGGWWPSGAGAAQMPLPNAADDTDDFERLIDDV